MISIAPPFVPSINSGQTLRLSKDERRVFQQNQNFQRGKTQSRILLVDATVDKNDLVVRLSRSGEEPRFMRRTQVIIVRHGQTQWNIRGIRQGHLDSELTEKGISQAKALAERLAREKFSALYSSDLGRAVETAQMIAEATEDKIVTDARLRERHLGIFQGLNGEEIKEKYPAEYKLHRSLGPNYVIPGGESTRQQVDRNVACLNELARKHAGETIVVVTHGGVVSGFFRHTLSIPLEAPRRFEFVNAGLNRFNYEDGAWFLQTWGDVSHLAPGGGTEGEDP
jgi:probable phosphoglycerate mutase